MIRYFLKENRTAKGSRKRTAAMATPDLNVTYNASGPKRTPSTDPGPNSRQVAGGGGKEFRCPKCPKAYTTLRAMKNHAASHTETKVPAAAASVPAPQKTVVCSVCGDKFSEVRTELGS